MTTDLEFATTTDIVRELGRRKHKFILIDLDAKTDLNNQIVMGNMTLGDGAYLLSMACDYVLESDNEWVDDD